MSAPVQETDGEAVVKRASSSFEEVPINDRDGRFTGGANDRDGRFTRAVLFPDTLQDTEGRFFSPDAETAVHVRNLPHWAQDGKLVFITFRLADSVPQEKLREWEAEKEQWMRVHPEPWDDATRREYSVSFPKKMQDYLDSGYGSCILVREDCRAIVESAIEHFNGVRYRLHAYVVMPNHVHVLMELAAMGDLASVTHSWKSYTAKGLNRATGREGPVWRHESYDRLIRNQRHYKNVVDYIVANAGGRVVKRASSSFEEVPTNDRDGRFTEDANDRDGRFTEDANDRDGRFTGGAHAPEGEKV